MKVYISGAITGVKDYKKKFEESEKILTEKGYEVINPTKVIQENSCFSYIDYICFTLKLLEKCDCMCMLDNWEESTGAKVEFFIANKLGIKIMQLRGDI